MFYSLGLIADPWRTSRHHIASLSLDDVPDEVNGKLSVGIGVRLQRPNFPNAA